MIQVNVKDFSEFPGPRREAIGPNSGEKFRDTVLLPVIIANPSEKIIVNLDGTAGYGSSFLEEAFGGLVRKGVKVSKLEEIIANLVSTEDESLIDEIREYIAEAQEDAK